MNITVAELAELPLAAATFDARDTLVAATPEWRGALPGSVAYPVRRNRLVVSTGELPAHCAALTSRLLDSLDAARPAADAGQSRRIAMLATSLRLVAGRAVHSVGTSDDVLELTRAGLDVRTSLPVSVERGSRFTVTAPEAVALVVVQLAVNAERHGGARSLAVEAGRNAFHVTWQGAAGPGDDAATPATGRRRRDRRGWGLGFARIAADTVGAAVLPLYPAGDGAARATVELGVERLALPLALLRAGRVVKATRAWDEETGLLPGADTTSHPVIPPLADLATSAPGRIASHRGWTARAAGERVWVAIPPDDVVARCADVLTGLAHERALWDGVAEPLRSSVYALACLLGATLGIPLPRVPARTWERRMEGLGQAFGVAESAPRLAAMGAVDPRIATYLRREVGARYRLEGEDLLLAVRPDRMDDPLAQALVEPALGAIRLS